METPFNDLPIELLPMSCSSLIKEMNEVTKDDNFFSDISLSSQVISDSTCPSMAKLQNFKASAQRPKFSIKNHLRNHVKFNNNQNLT